MSGKAALGIYPRSRSTYLDAALFKHPTSEYRGVPFWAWNDKLDIPRLLRQIDHLQAMGFGGFLIHSRTGLNTEYLGQEYMNAVASCLAGAARSGMRAWLYDEDRWPSGFAGGLVTRDPQHRIKHLLWTTTPYHTTPPPSVCPIIRLTRSEDGVLLARYEVILKRNRLERYRRLGKSARARKNARIWHAYLETPMESTWFNGQTAVDTFSKAAIQRFIETTHERFSALFQEYFGNLCPAFFTDEPQFTKKSQFRCASETRDLFMPFTTDFPQTYQQSYREDLLDHLPELFWDLPDGQPSQTRYRYHDHTAERFASAFGDTLAHWCEKHGIALTGHMLAEANLHSQTRGGGEVMRGMRSFQIPGIDILCDRMELTTAKQAQSLAHQHGRTGVLSELYGVTNWDFDFVGHKAQGDWQAALGVTVRVPHLAWFSMAGESKRDYPASIGYQSPWHCEYALIEDHFARIATILTRGKPAVRVGVIHPLESSWLNWGPIETNQTEIEEQEEAFTALPSWLLFGQVDFDYISEALLPAQCPKQTGSRLRVGEMLYEAVLVPNLKTIRASTLQRLDQFSRAGGLIIFAGEPPRFVDAKPSDRAKRLAKRCTAVPFSRRAILNALARLREVEISNEDGSPADSVLYQMRVDGKRRHLFFCNTDRVRSRANTTIRITGQWQPILLDTMTGDQRPLAAHVDGRHTTIRWTFTAHGHLLLTLRPRGRTRILAVPARQWTESARLHDPVPITLSEPNVLLLDQAAWRLDEGPWQEVEEILRIDDKVRQQLRLPPRTGRSVQPWADTSPAPVIAKLQLRFVVRSDVHIASPQLAIEQAASIQIQLDRANVPSDITGWWVDEAIEMVSLPALSPGEHELLLTIPLTRKTDVEWCYLLGDFGVVVAGRHAKLTAPVRSLAFGDWTRQGLPFYAGNVTYHCDVDSHDDQKRLEVAKFKSPLLSVSSNGELLGKIAFAPFQLSLPPCSDARLLDITAYGNRVNAFGALHNADDKLTWFGPPAWRSTGSNWSYEYQFRPMGILAACRILSC